jgi:hypothetical protein
MIDMKKGEVIRNYFTSELASLRANLEKPKNNPYDKNEPCESEWYDEWVCDMATIKRRIDKLKKDK